MPGWHTFAVTASTSRSIAVGNFGIRAFVTVENLTDRRYIGSAFVNPDVVNGEPVAFEPGAPRSLIVSLSVGPVTR